MNDFGQITDDMLINAIRQRVLEDIKHRESQNTINNIIGGGEKPYGLFGEAGNQQAPQPDMGGMAEEEEGFDPGNYNYGVDILKEDIYDPKRDENFAALQQLISQHPELGLKADELPLGKPVGWRKKVRRYREDGTPIPENTEKKK